ncbi:MAG: hypothetical protein IKD93_01425 [Firmicutes bacterium]|nr:hypothetical protein [Bacillota bacterium]
MKKRVYDDDDGRVVADMSVVERPPLLLPRLRRRPGAEQEQAPDQPLLSREDRRAVVLGSLSAVLAIGLVFLAAAALVIGVMLLLWD